MRAGSASRVGRASSTLGAPVPVDEVGAHAESAGALDVVLEGIADHHRGLGRDAELVEDDHEDRRAGLHLPVPARPDPGVHGELEVLDERAEIAARVRDEPDLHAPRAEEIQDGQDVLVELEVLRREPAVGDRLGNRAARLALTAHPADDVLGEAEPDLLVVLELGVLLQVEDRGGARLGIALRVEVEAEPLPRIVIPARPEQGPRLGEGEVDVEEDRFDRQTPVGER